MILDKCSYRIGKLIKIADTGEIPSVYGMRGRYIFIISCKNTDDGDPSMLQCPDFSGSIKNTVLFNVIYILTVLKDLNNIMGAGI